MGRHDARDMLYIYILIKVMREVGRQAAMCGDGTWERTEDAFPLPSGLPVEKGTRINVSSMIFSVTCRLAACFLGEMILTAEGKAKAKSKRRDAM